jgi:hypothetical protein
VADQNGAEDREIPQKAGGLDRNWSALGLLAEEYEPGAAASDRQLSAGVFASRADTVHDIEDMFAKGQIAA